MFASFIMSQNDHGYEAGRYVAAHALAAFQESLPSLLVACISQQYQKPEEVARGIRSLAGTVPLIGACSNNIYTMTGPLGKGVAVLAVRADTTPCAVGISCSTQQLQNAIQQAHEQAQAGMLPSDEMATGSQLPSTRSAENNAREHAYTTMLVFTSGTVDTMQLHSAVQAFNEQMPSRSMLFGAAMGAEIGSGNGGVFANDTFVHDGVVVGLLRTSAPPGVGIASASDGAQAQDAAGQAVAMVGRQPVAGALVVDAPLQAEQSGKVVVDDVRVAIGPTTPLIGLTAACGFAINAVYAQSLLVYTIGM